jgi:hypothetical protein
MLKIALKIDIKYLKAKLGAFTGNQISQRCNSTSTMLFCLERMYSL